MLDAGSGGFVYLSPPHQVVAVDMVFGALDGRGGPAVVADLHELPFLAGCVDSVLCVGSVANYIDLYTALGEFARVLADHGSLVLEYERSASWLTLGTRSFGKESVEITARYGRVVHRLRLYSDQYVAGALLASGFRIEKRRVFHAGSALALRLGIRWWPRQLDSWLGHRWVSRLGANAVLLCSRG